MSTNRSVTSSKRLKTSLWPPARSILTGWKICSTFVLANKPNPPRLAAWSLNGWATCRTPVKQSSETASASKCWQQTTDAWNRCVSRESPHLRPLRHALELCSTSHRLRLFGGPPERRQVHALERPHRPQNRNHRASPPDHSHLDSRRADHTRSANHLRRHSGHPPIKHAPEQTHDGNRTRSARRPRSHSLRRRRSKTGHPGRSESRSPDPQIRPSPSRAQQDRPPGG